MGCLIVLLLVLQYRLWFGEGSIRDVWRLHSQLTEQRSDMQELITRNQALEAEVSDLKSGLDAIEERARARLGMIDEDETFYQFVRDRAGEPVRGTGDTGDMDGEGAAGLTERAPSTSPDTP